MFIDEARIRVKAGNGGDGCVSFRREKSRPRGGPDGGDGGRGGNIYIRASASRSTLFEYRNKKVFIASSGKRGSSSCKTGSDGRDLFIDVPVGTIVRNDKGEIIADLLSDGQSVLVARGGRGGRGNASLVKEAGPLPRFAEKGEPGEELEIHLELRIVADVAIVGLPNAGKSTLITRVSRARPKVADYPFTTKEPHLGVVNGEQIDFVVTDVPGLVKGAHKGKGMGVQFLRHITRAHVIVCLVDVSLQARSDPVEDLKTVLGEIELFDRSTVKRVKIVAANKIDLPVNNEALVALKEECRKLGLNFKAISAVRGDGVEDLKIELEKLVLQSRKEVALEERIFTVFKPGTEPAEIEIERDEGRFIVKSGHIERMVLMTDWDSDDALEHLSRKLKSTGIEDALVKAGAKSGDEVVIAGRTFEFIPDEEIKGSSDKKDSKRKGGN